MDNIRINNLNHQRGIMAEMRRIYRDSRRGAIDVDTGKTLMNMLRILSENGVAVELEQKVEEIEAQSTVKTSSIHR